MAHEINANDRLVLNSGMKAWHGLGEVIDRTLSPREAVRKVLPWEPEPKPIYFLNAAGEFTKIDGHKANVRSDDQTCLGVVTDNYKIVANSVLGDFAEAIVGADAAVNVETAGSLMGGRRVFMLCKIPRSIRVGRNGEDETIPYLIVSNTHDGTSAFFGMWTGIRVVCNNTLSMALGANFENAEAMSENGRAFRFRHTGDVMDKIEQARRILGIATTTTERFAILADEMARKQVTQADVDVYWKACYIAIYGPRPDQIEQAEMWDERFKARVSEWESLMSDRKQNIDGVGGTVWAALQSVTEWHDHKRSATRVVNGRRQHSNLFGESARDKRGAFVAAVALLSK